MIEEFKATYFGPAPDLGLDPRREIIRDELSQGPTPSSVTSFDRP